VTPGLSTPSLTGAALMAVAGITWGIFSLLGRGSAAPVSDVTGTFLRLAPLTLAVTVFARSSIDVSRRGAMLAALSGVVTTAGGCVVWYAALRHLTATRASILQLSVPALAAIAGTLVLSEPMTIRLITSAILILGGIAISVSSR